MLLKDKFELSFLAFENQLQTNLASSVHQIRSNAFKCFERQGFPTTRQEAWKYTSLKSIIKEDYKTLPDTVGALSFTDVKPYFLNQTECYSLVFIDGVFSNFLSETTHEKIDVCVLSAALSKEKYAEVIHQYFGKLSQQNESLSALNTAFAKEGAYIKIPKGLTVDKPVQILNFNTSEQAQWLQPRNLIVLEENTEIQIIERHQNLSGAKTVNNSVTEIFLAADARLDYYKIQDDVENASILDHTFIQQKKGSNASVHTFSMGASKLIRNNLSFDQQGSGCESNLNGVSILENKQHADNHTLVAHNAPNCTSNENYKGIYNDRSTGVFNGRVWVDKDAQQINAYQQSDNILIGEKATVNTKPQLEIFADDVKCSHGCTIGQLDENALFYMQQRGIAKEVAKSLLIYAFASEAVSDIKIPELQMLIDKMITKKLNLEIGFAL